MSSAFYPQGMKSYNNHVPQGGYKTWKGAGVYSNPIGIAPGHIRPLTNKDPGNVFPTGFGLPRPIKHFRRGRSIRHGAMDLPDTAEGDQIDYNVHRYVKSSRGQSLGGGNGGAGLVQTMMDAPGEYLVKENKNITPENITPENITPENITPPTIGYSTYSSSIASPGITIDKDNFVVTDDITITTNNQLITRLEVIINELRHTWVGDLEITLTNVNTSTSTVLMNRSGTGNWGSDGDDFIDTIFSDSATTSINSISSGDSPHTGIYSPSNDNVTTYLSNFNNENINSTWRLTVRDSDPSSGDGLLVKWSLRMYHVETSSISSEKTIYQTPITLNVTSMSADANLPADKLNRACDDCEGVAVVSSWYPIRNLTDKPEPVTTTPMFCCNEEYKARRRSLPTSTNVSKNYYQTQNMYLYNRCQTFQQREFNFITKREIDDELGNPAAKPGSAAAMGNLYVANCNPNGIVTRGAEHTMMLEFAKAILTPEEYADFIQNESNSIETIAEFVEYLQQTVSNAQYLKAVAYMDRIIFNPATNPQQIGIAKGKQGCKRVYYKPNNPTFAKEGAVSSATRTFKLNVDTIEKNAASVTGNTRRNNLITNNPPNTSYIYKMKTPKCQPSTYAKQFQNPRICNVNTNDISSSSSA